MPSTSLPSPHRGSTEPPFPLAGVWQRVRDHIATLPTPQRALPGSEIYLDASERIVRTLAAWQDDDGIIRDPFADDQFYVTNRRGQRVLVHTQARYLGALGNLLAAGRCEDLVSGGLKAYEERLEHLDEEPLAPEFYIKEMVWAHRALKVRVDPERASRWESRWLEHDPWSSYRCARGGEVGGTNCSVFALAGEFLKQQHGLGGDDDLMEEALAYLACDFTPWGMYRDPQDPMTYDLVVKQQLDLIRHLGYCGPHQGWIDEICQRGATTSLLSQSSTGQMPFGGRSNQFHLMEAHFACLCETQATRYHRAGDAVAAGIYKRAGRRAVGLVLPWIMEMEPFRHTKQGFHPSLGHGVDSGGPYSVYGALAASLLAAAYHLADDGIGERLTPAEVGGFAFDLWPAFHKVFASCSGYHVEVDTRADPEKDATGLGRVHRCGVRPETALSGSISARATYSFGVERPARSLAIGPVWRHATGVEHRLADFGEEITQARLTVLRETPEEVAFRISYAGDLGGCREVAETYTLAANGVSYSVRCEPRPMVLGLLVPLIQSDGDVETQVAETDSGVDVRYRDAIFRVRVPQGVAWRMRQAPLAANRNALYRTLEVEGNSIFLELIPTI